MRGIGVLGNIPMIHIKEIRNPPMTERHEFSQWGDSNMCCNCDKLRDHPIHYLENPGHYGGLPGDPECSCEACKPPKSKGKTKDVEFASGAKRSSRKPPYHLVPRELLEAVAWTRFDGDAKYAVGNWKQGDREFFVDCLSHAIEHLYEFPDDEGEDHLGHAACNIAFILWGLTHGKVNRGDFRNVASVFKQIREERLARMK